MNRKESFSTALEIMDSHLLRYSQPDGAEIAAKLVSIFSITFLSLLFGIKTYNVHFKYLTYSRWLILALYVISWAFCATSMLLVTTNNGNYTSCFLSIMACDIFYSGTKIVIYCWLIEKVYVVSSIRQARWKSRSYLFHMSLLLPYIAIFTLMLIFHTSEIQADGICIIGLQSIASLPLLIYDFFINSYMTVFFIRPLMKLGAGTKSGWRATRLNEVALRTMVASIVCLLASFANVLSLVLLNGRERGLVCLTCCTVDVTINVITIHWVTSQAPGKRMKETGVDLSTTHNRDSNHENSFHNKRQPHNDFNNFEYSSHDSGYQHRHDNNNLGAMVRLPEAVNFYGFTNNDFQNDDLNSAPPYTVSSPANLTILHNSKERKEFLNLSDLPTEDNDNCSSSSSIHESQSSRKSLTPKM